MTISVLRTADGWWVKNAGAAARIDTDAVTTGELLADRSAIDAASSRARRTEHQGSDTVPIENLHLASPVTKPCRVVAQMTNFESHVKDSGMDPASIPLTFFRKSSASISGPFDDIVKPESRTAAGLRGGDRPGDRPRNPGGHNDFRIHPR